MTPVRWFVASVIAALALTAIFETISWYSDWLYGFGVLGNEVARPTCLHENLILDYYFLYCEDCGEDLW